MLREHPLYHSLDDLTLPAKTLIESSKNWLLNSLTMMGYAKLDINIIELCLNKIEN